MWPWANLSTLLYLSKPDLRSTLLTDSWDHGYKWGKVCKAPSWHEGRDGGSTVMRGKCLQESSTAATGYSTPTPVMNNELILIPWSGNSLWPVIKIHPVCEPQAQDRLAPARAELICTLPPSPQPPEGELIWTEHQRPSPSWCLSSPPLHGQGQRYQICRLIHGRSPCSQAPERGAESQTWISILPPPLPASTSVIPAIKWKWNFFLRVSPRFK